MEIYYENKEISDFVQVSKCVVRDTCGERCDSLEIEFENAAGWYNWGPEEDDRMVVALRGYDTGVMYLNTVLPEDGKYRAIATSLPCISRKKEYRSFVGKSIADILRTLGMVTGMGFATYGIDENAVIPYAQQENESAAAFLSRLLKWEGAVLKCINGKYAAIGIDFAQKRNAHKTIEMNAKQRGTEYRRGGGKLKSVTVFSPYAKATAEDLSVKSTHAQITLSLPARNNLQAGRWARGMLLAHNRQDEALTLETEFQPGFTAMTRVDVTGSTDAAGEWLIDCVEHDLKNGATRTTLKKCIRTIR